MSTTSAKLIPVSRPTFGEGEETAVVEVLRSGWVTQGPRVAEFESRFAEYVGAPHAVAVVLQEFQRDGHRLEEAGPAAGAVELVVAAED